MAISRREFLRLAAMAGAAGLAAGWKSGAALAEARFSKSSLPFSAHIPAFELGYGQLASPVGTLLTRLAQGVTDVVYLLHDALQDIGI